MLEKFRPAAPVAALAAFALAALTLTACGGGSSGGSDGAGGDPGGNSPTDARLEVVLAGDAGAAGGRVVSQPSGIGCGSACSATFNLGTSVTLDATPAGGRVFAGWSGDCSGSAATCSVSMDRARSVTARFDPAPPAAGWDDLAQLSAAGADEPRIVIDAAGRATAIWRQLDTGASRRSVWTSHRPAGGRWSPPALLENSDHDVGDAALAVDPASGRTMAIWWELAGSSAEVHARAGDGDGRWSASARIGAQGRNAARLHVGLDAAGSAVAMWNQTDTTSRNSIWANRYSASGGWGSALRVADDGAQDLDPSLAVSADGSAVVVWSRLGSGIWASRAAAGGAWGTPVRLAAGLINVDVGAPRVAADANGNAVAVWAQSTTSGGRFATHLVSRRLSGGAWSASTVPLYAPVPGDVLSEARLAVDGRGRFAAAWGRVDGSVHAAWTDASGAWGTPATVRAAGSELRSLPDIGLDSHGDAFATWSARNAATGTEEVWIARFTGSGGWTAPSLHQPAGEIGGLPRVAVNARGDAALVWIRNSGDGSRIAARSFTSGR